MKAPTAAELRKEASALGLTLVGNARLKTTKEAWMAEIEAAKAGKVVPIASTGTQEEVAGTKYVTVEQAKKAAARKGYTIKIDSHVMKIHIIDEATGKTAATVWLTSDVIKWLRTAPKVTVEIETTDDFNEVEKAADVQTVKEAITAIATVAETTVNPEPVKPAKTPKQPQAPQKDKEALRAENVKHSNEIRDTLAMMGTQAFEVTNWLSFQAKIYQGKTVLGFIGVDMMTGKPWFRPNDAKISKQCRFPVDSVSSAVAKVISWKYQQSESA